MNRTAVIGAGWAGLAAASALRDAGDEVYVFEASHTPGGRARRVDATEWPAPLDNGQHILLGAYTECLALMRRLGRDPERLLMRRPLHIERTDGSFRLHAPRLPAPLHAAWALARAQGLGWAARWAAVRMMRALARQRWAAPAELSVAALLRLHAQPEAVVAMLWEPLCLAALNTPVVQASAQLFVRVLGDALGGKRRYSDLLLPRCDLSELWPDAAAARCKMRYGVTVRTLTPLRPGAGPAFDVGGERFDAVVVATPPAVAQRLLQPYAITPDEQALCLSLTRFSYSPIATLNLRLAAPWRLPQPMMMLAEDAARGHDGQWVFDRAALAGRDDYGELAIVVSAAERLLDRDREQTAQALIEQLRQQCGRLAPMPAVRDSLLYVDKRATFEALPDMPRPSNRTPWPGLVLAGDWTDTGYPGVLEGAVRSGAQAARQLIEARGS
jgi:squalene-associated FAD-dependent desaturase